MSDQGASIIRASRALVAAVVLLIAGACSSEAEQAQDAFLASCEAAGGTESACQCSVDSLKDKAPKLIYITTKFVEVSQKNTDEKQSTDN